MIWFIVVPAIVVLVLLALFGGRNTTQEYVQIDEVYKRTRRNDA